MKYLSFLALISLCAGGVAFSATATINIEKVAKDNRNKIQKLKQNNRKLLGNIEQLQEQQRLNQKKITELFRLMEHKESSRTKKEVILQVEKENRVAKKLYGNARSFLATEQYNQAIDIFLNYLTLYPEDNQLPDVYYWLGKAYTAKGEQLKAKKIFTDFQNNYSLHPKFVNVLYELSVIEHELGGNQVAIQLLASIIRKFPNHKTAIQAQALLEIIQSKNLKKPIQQSGQTVRSK